MNECNRIESQTQTQTLSQLNFDTGTMVEVYWKNDSFPTNGVGKTGHPHVKK